MIYSKSEWNRANPDKPRKPFTEEELQAYRADEQLADNLKDVDFEENTRDRGN